MNEIIDFKELTEFWRPYFETLANAGSKYNPESWEDLWPGAPARWVLKFLMAAKIASADSTCFNRHTGATLVDIKEQRNGALAPFVLTNCFNGAPTGITPCTKLGYCRYKKRALEDFASKHRLNPGAKGLPEALKQEFREFKERHLIYCQAIHAEENAVYFSPVPTQNKILFATTNPCPRCARLIVQKGIATIIYSTPYKTDPLGRPLLFEESEYIFKEANVPCVFIPIPDNYHNWLLKEIKKAGMGIKDAFSD